MSILWELLRIHFDIELIILFRFSEKYGHFAQFVLDRNTHVGCSMVRFTHAEYKFLYKYHLSCNYASVYALEVPVYAAGKPASGCQTGPNPKYPGLCSTKEAFNPNF